MGSEIKCRAKIGRTSDEGTALLETKELVFRGARRVVVPFASMKSARADEGDLVVLHEGGELRLSIGAKSAASWADKIKNPKSVIDKLGIEPEHKVLVLHVEDEGFLLDVSARAKTVAVNAKTKDNDHVFFGADARAHLARFAAAKAAMAQDGAVWVVRRKGTKDITEGETMRAGREAGLVDVKVVAFSPTHTAEKFVLRRADRVLPAQRK